MIWFVALLLSLIMIAILVGGAYMHDAIDWYIEPKETELEKKVNEFHDGLKILLYMVKSFFKIT